MSPNPYVGPRSIGGVSHQGEKLYGRDREVADLLDLLIAERIVLLYSPSGAGKSSLLNAGIAPAMAKRRFQIQPVIRVGSTPPPGIDFDERQHNRYALSCLLSLEEGLPEEKKTPAAELARKSLPAYLGNEAKTGELYIFDQFEEILTADPTDHHEKMEFFLQLGEVFRKRGRWVVFAMREDYLAGLDPYLQPMPTSFSNNFRLDLLKREGAIEAIRRPAAERGVNFHEDAAAALVSSLQLINVQADDGTITQRAGQYVEPVQLQVVCHRLWNKLAQDATEIRIGDLAQAGHVDEALGGYYSDAVTSIAAKVKVAERDVRDWFDQSLITKQNTRGQVPQGSEDLTPIRAALKLLSDAYLIRSDKRLGSIWYELAHDRMIAPVQVSNRAWRKKHLSLLQSRAETWIASGRSNDHLLSSGELAGAKTWAAAHGPLRDEEKEFLNESEEELTRVSAVEETQAQRSRGKWLAWMLMGALLLAALSGWIGYTIGKQG